MTRCAVKAGADMVHAGKVDNALDRSDAVAIGHSHACDSHRVIYSQLTSEQQYQLYALLKAEHTLTIIAELVGKHKSTISREIARNTGGRGYRPIQPQRLCDQRQQGRYAKSLSGSEIELVNKGTKNAGQLRQFICRALARTRIQQRLLCTFGRVADIDRNIVAALSSVGH